VPITVPGDKAVKEPDCVVWPRPFVDDHTYCVSERELETGDWKE
jgi:hypothetical protein